MTAATTSTPLVAISTMAVLLGVILMTGSVWWAILLLKDAKKHKKFAKAIRLIAGSIQIASLIGSIVITLILFSKTENIGYTMQLIINILLVISTLAIITNTRWAILLFIQSRKMKHFNKWIRIICGILMLLSLFSAFISGL